MRISELQNKDVINIKDGKKVGNIIDVMINQEGKVISIIVEGLKGIKALVHAHSSKLNVYRVICSIKAFNSDEKVQTQLFNEAIQVLKLTEKAKNEFTYEKLITVSKNTHYTKRSLLMH